MSAAEALKQARAFADENLRTLAAEILNWQDAGILQGPAMHELAAICRRIDGAHPMMMAESLVNKAALRRVVGLPIPSQDTP